MAAPHKYISKNQQFLIAFFHKFISLNLFLANLQTFLTHNEVLYKSSECLINLFFTLFNKETIYQYTCFIDFERGKVESLK